MKKAKELLKPYIEQAKEPGIEDYIKNSFDKWCKRVGNSKILSNAKNLFNYMISGNVSGTDKLILIASLLYIIAPLDFIPDSMPIIGWLDDIGIAAFCLNFINSSASVDTTKKLSYDEALDTEIDGTDNNFKLSSMDKAPRLNINVDFKSDKLNKDINDLRNIYYKLSNDNNSSFFDDASAKLEESRVLKVAFVGRYNTGKSTLVNAFLNRSFLPIGAIPTTKANCYITKGEKEAIYYENSDGEIIISEKLSELSKPNRELAKATQIAISIKDYPYDDLTLIDTPGLEDPNEETSKVTRQIIKEVDAFIVVLDSKYLLSKPEFNLLQNLTEEDSKRKIFVVMNKSENMSDSEISSQKASLDNQLKEAGILEARIFAVSAENPQILEYIKFKEELSLFLRNGLKAETVKHIKESVKSFSKNLLATSINAIDNINKSQAEKEAHRAFVKKEIDNISKAYKTQIESVSIKFQEIKKSFYADYDRFFADLKFTIGDKISKIKSLSQLKDTDYIALEIEGKIKEYLERKISELQKIIESDISLSQKTLSDNLSNIQIEIDSEIKDYSVFSSLFMPVLALVSWNFMGIFNFAYTMIIASIGRSFFEKNIEIFLRDYGLNKVRENLVSQIKPQIDVIRDKIRLELNKSFDVLENKIIEEFEKSKLEKIAPLSSSIKITNNSVNQFEELSNQRNQLVRLIDNM